MAVILRKPCFRASYQGKTHILLWVLQRGKLRYQKVIAIQNVCPKVSSHSLLIYLDIYLEL